MARKEKLVEILVPDVEMGDFRSATTPRIVRDGDVIVRDRDGISGTPFFP